MLVERITLRDGHPIGGDVLDDMRLDHLIQAVGLEGVRDALEHFARISRVEAVGIVELALRTEPATIARWAYELKVNAWTFGLEALGRLAEAIERAARNDNREQLRHLVPPLLELRDRSVQEARDWLDGWTT